MDGLNGKALKAENDFQSFARRRGSGKAIAIDARAVRYVIRTHFNQGAAAVLRPMAKKDCLRAYAERDEQATDSEANFDQRTGSDAGNKRFPTERCMGVRGGREILHACERPAP